MIITFDSWHVSTSWPVLFSVSLTSDTSWLQITGPAQASVANRGKVPPSRSTKCRPLSSSHKLLFLAWLFLPPLPNFCSRLHRLLHSQPLLLTGDQDCKTKWRKSNCYNATLSIVITPDCVLCKNDLAGGGSLTVIDQQRFDYVLCWRSYYYERGYTRWVLTCAARPQA